MRQITRPALSPPTLRRIETRHGDAWKETGQGGPSGSDWNEPDVRGALIAMHGFACAYCELDLRDGDRGDVEHFRPKSIYRWLAYSFDNYLLSCIACNREMKGNRFPLDPQETPIAYRDRSRLGQERRLLLDPASDPTAAIIDYDVFNPDTLCKAIPRQGLPPREVAMARETIRFYEFNAGREVAESRRDTVAQVQIYVSAMERGDDRARELLTLMACRFMRHSTVVRALLTPSYPELIPDAEEELFQLIAELAGRLTRSWARVAETTDARAIMREQRTEKELLHALAVLWLAPPVLGPDTVAAALEELGVKAAVEPVHATLKAP